MTTKALSLMKIDKNIDWKDNPVPQKYKKSMTPNQLVSNRKIKT